MKTGFQIPDYPAIMFLILVSCMSIIGGIQGFLYKDSVMRGYSNYKFASVGSIIMGLLGFVGALIMISRL